MLLLRRLGARRAEGVAVAMFGHTGLGILICVSGRSASHGVTLTLMRVADALPRMGWPLRRPLEFTLESKRRQGVRFTQR